MKKYKIRKYYAYYLEGVIEAENAEIAEEEFDSIESEQLTEEYIGNININAEYSDNIKEIIE